MKKLFLFFIITACTTSNSSSNLSNEFFDYKKDISFIDFKKKLKKYNNSKEYPEIDSK